MSDVKIFAKTIEQEAINQVYIIAKHPVFEHSQIRIMPDAHAGKGCVIGFTAKPMNGSMIPSLVGVDIACGMLTARLHPNTVINEDILKKLDAVIRKEVPAGRNVHNKERSFDLESIFCHDKLHDKSHILRSIGTLGGGNHFIELAKDEQNDHYLIIHTGSRNLGKQVCDIYQQKAYDEKFGKNALKQEINELIHKLKADGRESEIESVIQNLKSSFKARYADMPKDLCDLSGSDAADYLHDALICRDYAYENRKQILATIVNKMGWKVCNEFTTLHNYVDEDGFIRKGAVYAGRNKPILIPLNMRDGSLLCIGKGNKDWNESAPHGAGRLFSRSTARKNISLDEYQNSMKDIFTTSVCEDTIDESPFAYKDANEIEEAISDTVRVQAHLKPVYNFKATE